MENSQQPPSNVPNLSGGVRPIPQEGPVDLSSHKKPFYKRPTGIVLIVFFSLIILITSAWVGYAYQTRDQASFKCQLAKPIMKVVDYRQQDYNEKCRIAFYEATVPLDTPADFVVFEYEFHSEEGAHGIVTIEFDGEVIATIDEAEVASGLQKAEFDFPTRQPGKYTLRIQTVPYTDVSSEFKISNFRFGYYTATTNSSPQQEEPNPSVRPLMEFTYNQDYSPSETGIVSFVNSDIELRTTDGPAWIYIPIKTNDWVVGLNADVDFTSEGAAEGLMAVYIDSEPIGGNIDERYHINFAENGRPDAWYTGPLEPGTYTLAFRLDAHTEVPSAIIIKNIKIWTYADEQFRQSEYYQYLKAYGGEL